MSKARQDEARPMSMHVASAHALHAGAWRRRGIAPIRRCRRGMSGIRRERMSCGPLGGSVCLVVRKYMQGARVITGAYSEHILSHLCKTDQTLHRK